MTWRIARSPGRFVAVGWPLRSARAVRRACVALAAPASRGASVAGWVAALVAGLVVWGGPIACASAWDGSVGAILAQDNRSGRVFVRDVPPGLGAAQAGLREGDEVVAIGGAPARRMSPDALRTALRGKVGSKVKLTIARDGEARDVVVERSPFQESP